MSDQAFRRILAASTTALAIVASGGLGMHPAAAGDARLKVASTFESWSWDRSDTTEAETSEWTTRIGCDYELLRGLTLQILGGWVRADQNATQVANSATTVSGPLDVRARLAYRVGDRWLMRFGINGPTGITEFSADEISLAQTLSARILAFNGHRLGEGFDMDAGLSYAFRAGPATIGVGAGYTIKGGYDVLSDGPEYDAGDHISLAGGVDLGSSRYSRWLWRTNARAVFYSSDQRDGVEVYQTSDRYEVQTLLRRRWLMTSAWVSATRITFGKARVPGDDGLVDEEQRSHGNELYLDIGIRRTLSPRFSAHLGVGVRTLAGNEFDEGKARRRDFRAGCRWRTTSRLGLELQGRYGSGRLDQRTPELNNAEGSDLAGLHASVAATLDF